jgi:hypothetical protein
MWPAAIGPRVPKKPGDDGFLAEAAAGPLEGRAGLPQGTKGFALYKRCSSGRKKR